MKISLRASSLNSYFHCTVNFDLSVTHRFRNLTVDFEADEAYVHVNSEVPLIVEQSFTLDVLHGYVDLNVLQAKKIQLSIADGAAIFRLDGDRDGYDFGSRDSIYLSSQSAPITIETRFPLRSFLRSVLARKALIRGVEVGAEHKGQMSILRALPTKDLVWSGSSFIDVTLRGVQFPLYVLARPPSQGELTLNAWAGVEQQQPPHFLPLSFRCDSIQTIKD
ncbi:MAG: uncharacterized protein KVP18_004019 [Porospora cf. gigantea A]|uniref:uncharacterized protein n=1 Tax=Porospora cf. gigantea A TaxID=2853593 RepID=UPI003559F410|nr:MAG: hypothetical protein KVP18_004019 [Porospora cf. gigantea A]